MQCNYYYSLKSLSSFFRLEMALGNVTVVMGIRTFSDVHLERKRVQKIIIHKDYKPSHLDSDLSLLLLATPIQFTNFKMPVCLQEKERIWDRCWMAEWVTDAYGMCLLFGTCRKPRLKFPWARQHKPWKTQVSILASELQLCDLELAPPSSSPPPFLICRMTVMSFSDKLCGLN